MKRFFCFILCAVAILGTPFGMDAQNRKAQRQARREQKSREREVADSMMKVLFGDRSVNVGYGSVKKRNLTTAAAPHVVWF